MIYFDDQTNQYKFYDLIAKYEAYGHPQEIYTNDTKRFERMVAKHSTNFKNLEFLKPIISTEQELRLQEVNNLPNLETNQNGEYQEYVEFHYINPETEDPFLQSKLNTDEAQLGEIRRAAKQKKLVLAQYRYERETAGVTLPDGSIIDTDRQSQAMLANAYNVLSQPFITTVDWKNRTGWVTIDFATVKPIYEICAKHVQKCFTAERKVCEYLLSRSSASEVYSADIRQLFDAEFDNLD